MADPLEEFREEVRAGISALGQDDALLELSRRWMKATIDRRYPYHFRALGRPIIQYPQDMVAIQELIYELRPDVIVETGIAHGGSAIMSAGALALLDMEDAIREGRTLDPARSDRKVVAVDIDIRSHNRDEIEKHPMASRIHMIEGSSVDTDIIAEVHTIVGSAKTVLVLLDSNHTHEHVLEELRAYAGLVTPGSYCVVFDTFVETLPAGTFENRPWDPGNSPMTAVEEFLKEAPDFSIDRAWNDKLQITVAPNGFLKRH